MGSPCRGDCSRRSVLEDLWPFVWGNCGEVPGVAEFHLYLFPIDRVLRSNTPNMSKSFRHLRESGRAELWDSNARKPPGI